MQARPARKALGVSLIEGYTFLPLVNNIGGVGDPDSIIGWAVYFTRIVIFLASKSRSIKETKKDATQHHLTLKKKAYKH